MDVVDGRHEIVWYTAIVAAVGILWGVADGALHGCHRVDRGGHASTARHLGQSAGDAGSHTASYRAGRHDLRPKHGQRDRADPAGDRSRDAHHPHIEVIDCPGHFGGRAANLTQHHKLVLPGIVAGRPDIARRDLPCLASLRPATAGANRLRCGR
ncbi:hypothetical protein G6F32_014521 [Rhizopus arrhizus]|nr:hypothetical protein G6F32_014521 [Rhizopus arrhizus]